MTGGGSPLTGTTPVAPSVRVRGPRPKTRGGRGLAPSSDKDLRSAPPHRGGQDQHTGARRKRYAYQRSRPRTTGLGHGSRRGSASPGLGLDASSSATGDGNGAHHAH